jgi:hypothetical protein
MRHRTRWKPRPGPEPSSPGVTIYFNPEASFPGPLRTPPVPLKLTDPQHHPSPDLKDATADFIQAHGPWGWLCHLTFSYDILEITAHHHFMRWIRGINEEIYGRRFREKGLGVTFARATEHQRNGRIHYHVLISEEVHRLPGKSRLRYKDYWEYGFPQRFNPTRLYGAGGNGFARIINFDRRKAGLAERYLVKYLTKERDIFLCQPSAVGQEQSSK